MLRGLIASAVFAILAVAGTAQAENHYVLASATGTGSGTDWTNAMIDLPSSFVRGDTYFVGDGTYGGHQFTTAESSTSLIYVTKATAAVHGTETGWLASFGDGQAVFSGAAGNTFDFATGHWNIDGVTGAWRTGHGFVVTNTACGTNTRLVNIMRTTITRVTDITIAHAELAHCGYCLGPYSQDAVWASGADGVTVSNCYIHDVNRMPVLLNDSNNDIVEFSVLERAGTCDAGVHMQGIQGGPGITSNVVIRYNIFADIPGTGQIVALDNNHTNWKIYGNVFYHTSTDFANSPEYIGNTTADTASGMEVYNNTFYNLNNMGAGGVRWVGGSNNLTYNNLVFNCKWENLGDTHDYNMYDDGTHGEAHGQYYGGTAAGLFQNPAVYNLRLNGATNPGIPRPSPYDHDPDGNLRGEDAVWDRGAFEFTGTAPVRPKSPTDLLRR